MVMNGLGRLRNRLGLEPAELTLSGHSRLDAGLVSPAGRAQNSAKDKGNIRPGNRAAGRSFHMFFGMAAHCA
jgi:hypothetical protein